MIFQEEDVVGLEMVMTDEDRVLRWLDGDQIAEIRGLAGSKEFIKIRETARSLYSMRSFIF